jgi:D-inositol-3-phosphate glycosyltransferase
LKAVLIGPAHPLRGGIANFNESLALSFIKNGIEAEIITFYYQYPAFLFPGKTQLSEGKAPTGLNIQSLISSINPFSWMRTARTIRKINPDIIIVQYWLPLLGPALGSILWLLGKKRKSKIIAIVHNAIPHEKKPGDKLFTKFFLGKCGGFICLSKSVLEDIAQFTTNTNKLFIPHPVYDIFGNKISKANARQFLDYKEEDKIILFFGIVRKYKGLELLLKSLAVEKIKNENIKLLVAGEFYEDKAPYVSLIEKLGIKKNIIFYDSFIPTEHVKYYFCAADIVVQPYMNATQSGVTQIAYNFERPMLVTNVGGLAEIVFHNYTGYVTEVNENSLADALYDFYSKNREEEISQNVAKEKYRFSWNTMVDSILELTSGK